MKWLACQNDTCLSWHEKTPHSYQPAGAVTHTDMCKYLRSIWTLVFISRMLLSQINSFLCIQEDNTMGGADKSFAWPTSWCRGTESRVSFERGVCSYAELQVFSCYWGQKEACQVTCAISTHGDTSCHQVFFFSRQGTKGNSRHSDRNLRRTCTIVCHRQKLGGPV